MLALDSAVCVGKPVLHLYICVSGMFADMMGCNSGNIGFHQCGFDKAWWGVSLSQRWSCYALETQHPACSLLVQLRKVYASDIVFPLVRGVETYL